MRVQAARARAEAALVLPRSGHGFPVLGGRWNTVRGISRVSQITYHSPGDSQPEIPPRTWVACDESPPLHCSPWSASCSLPSGASARSQASYRSSTERVVFKLLNEIRRDHKLPPFTFSAALRRSAREHSADMLARQYFEHNAPNETFDKRIRRHLNSTLVGENIAWGTGTLRRRPRGSCSSGCTRRRTATSS